MPPLTHLSATALARAGEVSSRDVVEAHIELLERAQPRLNAIAVPRFEAARAEADAADLRVGAAAPDEELPPLLGVPCTIKEIFNVERLPHTVGLVARRGVVANSTAPVARRLLDAGAVLLGLTNTAELALWFETENRVYGRTRNPYDPSRTAGGSSGGCGAAVGCGGAPVALGTDTGGSLRVPAFWCGVFAHKPSLGLVPQDLDYPPIVGEAKRMVTFGPIVRRGEDLMPVLRLLAGSDPRLGDPAAVPIAGLRVLVSERAFMGRIRRELLEARERAAATLADAGARIERVALPEMRRMLEPALAMLSDGGRATLPWLLERGGAQPISVADALRPGGDHTVPLKLWALADRLARLTPDSRTRRALERGRRFAEELAATIGDGVLLHPPLPRTAPHHGATYGRLLFFQPTGIFNVAGLPVTQVPLGLGRAGLPLGVQVAAGPHRDHVTIAVALELERRFGGWVPAPAVAPA